MKKLVVVAVIATLSLALAACSSGNPSNSATGSASAPSATSQNAGLANPWSDVTSAAEAAKGAGIDSFTVDDGIQLSTGQIEPWRYRCMRGIAEADATVNGAKITVRKGINPGTGDISGDYNEYSERWTQEIQDIDALCYGSAQNKASKVLWLSNGYAFCACADNLNPEDVVALVNGVR